MAGHAKFWTMDKLDALAVMREAGADFTTIGAHFGVSATAAQDRFYSTRSVEKRMEFDSVKARARELWRQGKNTEEIARELRVSQAEIHNSRCYLEGR